MSCLLKITADMDIAADHSHPDKILIIRQLEISQARKIHYYITTKLEGYGHITSFRSKLITDTQQIKCIKEFFDMDQFYSNIKVDLFQKILFDTLTREYAKVLNRIKNSRYIPVIKYLKSLFDYPDEITPLQNKRIFGIIDNFFNLYHLNKLRRIGFMQKSESRLISLVADYLSDNSNLQLAFPNLFKRQKAKTKEPISQIQLNVRILSKSPAYYITEERDLIIRSCESNFLVCARLSNPASIVLKEQFKIVALSPADIRYAESVGLIIPEPDERVVELQTLQKFFN